MEENKRQHPLLDPDQMYSELEQKIAATGHDFDLKRIRAAYEMARAAHAGQKRKDGSPYVTHCVAAADISVDMGLDEDSIVAALLHDVIEDTPLTHADIARDFGDAVADIVEGVTKLTRVQYTSKEDEQMENLRKMLMAMAKDIRVILIKIADRLHNMRTMDYQTPEKQRSKSLETMEIYAPIAHRLGIQKVKWELEDLSLQYLDPAGYKEIADSLRDRMPQLERFMKNMEEKIRTRLKAEGIEATVYYRIKHIYSIYRKMYAQKLNMSGIFDLCAFRVIVDTIPDCYNVLGLIHYMFKPVPGRFKDYISTPKPNMYQSVHTTVIGSEGIPFEVQIRTWDMHYTAEYGVAAHWKYKMGSSADSSLKDRDEDKFAWIRRLLESQQESDASDFYHNLKVDMFADEVFVFSPKGDVINLPAGATPIDFAYSIHSDIGNHMVGAKVNGRIVTYDYTLQNGDIVEIRTSKSAPGPSRDWLNMAKSSSAKTKIKQWYKKERRDENIQRGREMLESDGGHQLEFRRMLARLVGHGLGVLAYEQRHVAQVLEGDVAPVDADALFELDDVGTREQTGPETGCLQDACDVGAGRALAVRAGDVHELQAVLGAAHAVEQVARAFQAQAGFLPARFVDVCNRIEVVHSFSNLPNVAKSFSNASHLE